MPRDGNRLPSRAEAYVDHVALEEPASDDLQHRSTDRQAARRSQLLDLDGLVDSENGALSCEVLAVEAYVDINLDLCLSISCVGDGEEGGGGGAGGGGGGGGGGGQKGLEK